MLKKLLLPLLLASAFICNLEAQEVTFSTDFDGGSLAGYQLTDSVWFKRTATDSVLMLSYDITSRFDPDNPIDVTLPPSGRWFYFRMDNVKGKQLYLNFVNTDPLRCVYSYDNENFVRLTPCEGVERNKVNVTFEQNTVYLAYYTPYTYSHLQKRLAEWVNRYKPEPTDSVVIAIMSRMPHKGFVWLDTIGYSTQNRPIQMLTITDSDRDSYGKKKIWIHGRIHPSESPASWHLDGFIDALLTLTPETTEMLQNAVFYIVPFINPDGVANGLSRSNANGVNMEINWGRPDDSTQLEVRVMKAKMQELAKDTAFDLFLNMHSQVANKASFWVHTAESTNGRFFQNEMRLAYLTCAHSSDYIARKDLDYSALASRYPEGWIWNSWGDKTMAITFETPYTYYQNKPDSEWVTTENLQEFGSQTLMAVSDYLNLCKYGRMIIDNDNAKLRGDWETVTSTGVIYYGNSCVKPKKKGSKITYKKDILGGNNYKVYAWYSGSYGNDDTYTNKWVYLQDYKQKKRGKFSLTLKVEELQFPNGEEVLYDAIMLVPYKE